MSPSPDSPLDPGYVDPILARRIARMKYGRDLDASLPGAAGPGFSPDDQTDQLLQAPLPNGAMRPPQASGSAGLGTGQPQTQPSKARMAPPGSSPVAPQTGGAPPPATGAAPALAAPAARQAPPGMTDYAARIAPLAEQEAALSTPVGSATPGGTPGQRPVLQSKGVGPALQRVAMALLSATKFAPYAQMIVHPQFTQQMATNQAQLEGIKDQLGVLKEGSAAQEQAGRAAWYQQQAAEGKGRYLRVGNGVFDQESGQWTEPPTDKTNLVKIDPAQAQARGLSPDKRGEYWVPGTVAAQFVKPARVPGDTIQISPDEGKRLGIQPDEDGKYYLPKEGIGPYVSGKEKPVTPQTSAQMDAQAQALLAKLGPVPPTAYTDMRQLGPLIDNSPNLNDQEKATLRAHFLDKTSPATSGTGGIIRIGELAKTRPVDVIDKQSGERKTITVDELQANPGRYMAGAGGSQLMNREAIFQDLHYNIDGARNAIQALDDMDAGTRAQLSYALRHSDSASAFQTFLTGTAATTMTPQQQEAVQWLALLSENALSLRSVAGMGQGAADLRSAILATIPSGKSPSKGYALGQLSKFEGVVSRLESPTKQQLGNPGGPPPPAGGGAVAKTYTQANVDAAVAANPGLTATQVEAAFKAKGWTKKAK